MKNGISAITLILVIGLLSPLKVTAEIITIDPDEFADGTDISNAFKGISLSTTGSDSTGAVFSRTDGHSSTGSQTFGNNATNGAVPDLVWFEGDGFDGLPSPTGSILRVDFDVSTDFVAIDIINQDSFDGGILRAFDSIGTEIDSDTSTVTGPSVELSISTSTANIAYVTIAGNSAQDSVHLDNFQFNKIANTNAGDPNFDTSTGIITFPRVTVNGEDAFLDVELLLNNDGTYQILRATPE